MPRAKPRLTCEMVPPGEHADVMAVRSGLVVAPPMGSLSFVEPGEGQIEVPLEREVRVAV